MAGTLGQHWIRSTHVQGYLRATDNKDKCIKVNTAMNGQCDLTCIGDDVTVGTFVLLQGEPRQVKPWNHLDRVLFFPLIDQIVFGPSVWKKEDVYRDQKLRFSFHSTHYSCILYSVKCQMFSRNVRRNLIRVDQNTHLRKLCETLIQTYIYSNLT